MFLVAVEDSDDFFAEDIRIENGRLYTTVTDGVRSFKLSSVLEVVPVELESRSPVERIEDVVASIKDLFYIEVADGGPDPGKVSFRP
ncbi:Hypothetical protein NGAL_HAMBI1145_13210 [Neorhizobium galegae bv. officinalis]|uniref:Uncharacterized protein n=1 Tax=Neorhizobium galegae bv. officinalis TaxID=323656 RepID=A0A0T7FBZ6_NEOGA|nr:hypothetical protein [Neorhizobium galegae]CDZ32550.1 Hypothetical protein NGAL_HAMBI1145_13210 [Neorhizobium galegae bv. officinalis]